MNEKENEIATVVEERDNLQREVRDLTHWGELGPSFFTYRQIAYQFGSSTQHARQIFQERLSSMNQFLWKSPFDKMIEDMRITAQILSQLNINIYLSFMN